MAKARTVTVHTSTHGDLDVPTRWRYAVIGRYGAGPFGSGPYLAMERGADTLDAAKRNAYGLHVHGGDLIVDTHAGARYAQIVAGIL